MSDTSTYAAGLVSGLAALTDEYGPRGIALALLDLYPGAWPGDAVAGEVLTDVMIAPMATRPVLLPSGEWVNPDHVACVLADGDSVVVCGNGWSIPIASGRFPSDGTVDDAVASIAGMIWPVEDRL